MRYAIKRILYSLIVIAAVLLLTFGLVRVVGDPVARATEGGGFTQEQIEQLRTELGYDRPILVQFGEYLGDLSRGEFGRSLQYGVDSMFLVLSRLAATAYLALTAFGLILVFGVPLGVLGATKSHSWIGKAINAFATAGLSIPAFVIALVAVLVFSVQLGWLPVSGSQTWQGIIIPAVALAAYPAARVIRLIGASMKEVSGADYVAFAHAKGLKPGQVTRKFVLRNALLPTVTVLGLQVSALLGGAVVVEVVFSWPGLGNLTHQALLSSDFNVVQTIVLLFSVIVVVINLATDVMYRVLDPRIRLR